MQVDKTIIVQHCIDQCQQKLSEIETAIAIAKESIFNDTKSSMGDKYETGREMAQQELNRLQQQENQVSADLVKISQLQLNPSSIVVPGSLIGTDQHTYFIGISLGAQAIANQVYMIISTDSPIAQLLLGKKKGDAAQFRNMMINILHVE